jgi:hypothetical protein
LGKEQRTMCLAKPISIMQTSLWYLLDAKERVEKLMAEVYVEQEIWKEGDYLLYTELLKTTWNRLNDWLDGDFQYMVTRSQEAWFESQRFRYGGGLPCYYKTMKFCDKQYLEDTHGDINITSVLGYFIKCCERYNTRKLIKKMKLEDNMRYRTLRDKLIKVQNFNCLNEGDEDTYTEYATEDGKKRYVWRPQIEAAYHPFVEMEHIDY